MTVSRGRERDEAEPGIGPRAHVLCPTNETRDHGTRWRHARRALLARALAQQRGRTGKRGDETVVTSASAARAPVQQTAK